MPACPSCGADLIPPYRFCGRCGAGVAPPPAYAYYPAAIPPKKDNAAIIIAVVLVVLVVGSIAGSAILYVMVSGLIGGTSRPVMTLVLSRRSNLSAVVLVADVEPATSPSYFKANIKVGANVGTAVGLPTLSGGTAPITVPGVGTFQLSWLNVLGSGLVTGGDQFSLAYPGFIPSGTGISLIFLWTDGSNIASVSWQA